MNVFGHEEDAKGKAGIREFPKVTQAWSVHSKAGTAHARTPPAARPFAKCPAGSHSPNPDAPEPSRCPGRSWPPSPSLEVMAQPARRGHPGKEKAPGPASASAHPRTARVGSTAALQARVPWQRPGKEKKGKSHRKSRGKKQKKPEVDILSPAAMLNLYYIAHNVADCLHLRGFRWPGAPKGKKGKNKT
uniref:small lysine-rich protein 1 n=1 Tax=Ictidomys tridecemlineatus TaxID=43179 RepID=UPI001A9F524A|nr:small lysine-rich protein 1 [Ictidomys tridecemlineatus]